MGVVKFATKVLPMRMTAGMVMSETEALATDERAQIAAERMVEVRMVGDGS
jgi:hypothetical protein